MAKYNDREVIISSILSPFSPTQEPNSANIRQWMDNIKSKVMPMETSRWNNANIDTLFYAGAQDFVNRQFNFNPGGMSYQKYYFNLCQQPVNILTGYQRQHRKAIMYGATQGSDDQTTDQYTKLTSEVCRSEGIYEAYSKSCELSLIAGLNLMQPYLDFTGDDPAQGQLKLKVWEYNSFLIDPYWRQPDLSDCNYIWAQEYIGYDEAQGRFGDKIVQVQPMRGGTGPYGNFYFLPENQNMANNKLYVVSYIWYRSSTMKKRLYSKKRNQFFDFAGGEQNLEQILYHIDDLEAVTVRSPCWKLCVVLNDQLMWQGINPHWNGPECPMIPNFWNYDPHINYYDLRSRSLIYTMRSPQFLFNYKVIQNNDIAAATINAGWMRKIGAVANEDNLKKSGQGWDVIINEGYELTDCQKIIPSAVPESDLALAQQMADLCFKVSGIDLENWSGQNDKQSSSLTLMLKQAASLTAFQKYFDQWDYALKLLGERILLIELNNWNEHKVRMIINEDPSPYFYSRIFAKYKTVVEESDLTPTQQNLQAQNMLDINQLFGREVFSPSQIIPKLNITGKGEIVPMLQQQEQQMQAAQQEEQNIQHSFEEMKMKELMAKIHNQLSQARERDSRSESNVGLFEERMSMISKNHALATKEKMAALQQLMETIQKYGEIETFLKSNELDTIKNDEEETEKEARQQVETSEASKRFLEQIMSSHNQPGQQQNPLAMAGDQQQMMR